jgi:mannose-6-phosphate isomerase-like protein (cupin superfamily)
LRAVRRATVSASAIPSVLLHVSAIGQHAAAIVAPFPMRRTARVFDEETDMQVRIHKEGEGRALDIFGNPMLEKAGSADLGGSAAVFVSTIAPRSGPPLHVHHEADEFFYVLEGAIDAWVGDAHVVLTPGMSATLPRGVPHRFDNCADAPARVLCVVTPGSAAGFFDDVDQARPKLPQDGDVVASIVARHAIELVANPPA